MQEKVYGQCPTCKQMKFWENQCYDVNCHPGTLIKILKKRLADAAKEESKTNVNECQQVPTTRWSKTNSKKSVTFDESNGSHQS